MRIGVISGSPKGELSVSLQYLRFIENHFPGHEFLVLHAGQRIHSLHKDPAKVQAMLRTLSACEAIFFVTPVYYYLVPGQLVDFLELFAQAGAGNVLAGKYAAVLTTSIHYFDHLAHQALRGTVEDLGMRYVDFFSADMHDLAEAQGRERLLAFAVDFFQAVKENRPTPRATRPLPEVAPLDLSRLDAPVVRDMSGKKAAILVDNLVDDLADDLVAGSSDNLSAMVARLAASLGPETTVVNLGAAAIKGGCLGCVECGLDNECAYQGADDVVSIYDKVLRAADIVVFATHLSGRFPSAVMKMFLDRGFFRNHAPMFPGAQFAWLADGPVHDLPHLSEMMQAFAEMSGASLCGILSDDAPYASAPAELGAALDNLAGALARRAASGYLRPPTFLSVAGRKLFRDDIYGRLRFVFQADHRYYKAHGFYDFPQKDIKTRLTNALFMTLTRIPALRQKLRKMFKKKMVEPLQKLVGPPRQAPPEG